MTVCNKKLTGPGQPQPASKVIIHFPQVHEDVAAICKPHGNIEGPDY